MLYVWRYDIIEFVYRAIQLITGIMLQVLLDDTSEKSDMNPPHTLVCPEPFDVYKDSARGCNDAVLRRDGMLWRYMAQIASFPGHTDDFIQRHPFPCNDDDEPTV
jgi:hypothetical protein